MSLPTQPRCATLAVLLSVCVLLSSLAAATAAQNAGAATVPVHTSNGATALDSSTISVRATASRISTELRVIHVVPHGWSIFHLAKCMGAISIAVGTDTVLALKLVKLVREAGSIAEAAESILEYTTGEGRKLGPQIKNLVLQVVGIKLILDECWRRFPHRPLG